MRTRYTINADGLLEDSHGNVLGRLVSLTIESGEGGAFKGGEGAVNDNDQGKANNTGRGLGRVKDEVDEIWDHYVEVMEPRRKNPDPGARALIRDALKVATAIECKRAIDGCKASRFHMGENDRGKKYNRLSHVLKGKRGTRTTREQIDLFLDIAEKAGVETTLLSVDPDTLSNAKRSVLDAWEFPKSDQAQKAGVQGAAWLAQHGYSVGRDPETGRPTFERGDENAGPPGGVA